MNDAAQELLGWIEAVFAEQGNQLVGQGDECHQVDEPQPPQKNHAGQPKLAVEAMELCARLNEFAEHRSEAVSRSCALTADSLSASHTAPWSTGRCFLI
jgi:hypothetical protein